MEGAGEMNVVEFSGKKCCAKTWHGKSNCNFKAVMLINEKPYCKQHGKVLIDKEKYPNWMQPCPHCGRKMPKIIPQSEMEAKDDTLRP